MTIPIIPGPFSALGQGLSQGLEAYNTQKDKQYNEAQTGARLILGLIQAGQLDPSVISDPSFQATLGAAKIPAPPAGAVVPSAAAQKQRVIARRGANVEPGSIAEDVLYDINGKFQVSEQELKTTLNDFQTAAANDPEFGAVFSRLMTGLVPGDIAQGRETATRASIAPKEYDYAADNFVAQAKGDAAQAKALAAADPQYADLVASGQLSDEYFARAAKDYARLDENQRIKWAEIAARRDATEREARLFYNQQRQAYDVQVQQLQNTIKQNALDIGAQAMLQAYNKKLVKNPAYQPNALESEAIRKKGEVDNATAEIERLTGERQDIIDRFIQRGNPIQPGAKIVPPQRGAPAERRGGTTLDPRLQAAVDLLKSGQGTPAQLQSSTAFSPAEKAQILQAAGKK